MPALLGKENLRVKFKQLERMKKIWRHEEEIENRTNDTGLERKTSLERLKRPTEEIRYSKIAGGK